LFIQAQAIQKEKKIKDGSSRQDLLQDWQSVSNTPMDLDLRRPHPRLDRLPRLH